MTSRGSTLHGCTGMVPPAFRPEARLFALDDALLDVDEVSPWITRIYELMVPRLRAAPGHALGFTAVATAVAAELAALGEPIRPNIVALRHSKHQPPLPPPPIRPFIVALRNAFSE